MPIIRSLLDNDLYKFTMQKAVLAYRQNVPVHYIFHDRRPRRRFNDAFRRALAEEIEQLTALSAAEEEIEFLQRACPFLGLQYLDYLRNYRYHADEVTFSVSDDGLLDLKISGPWERAILWEVPLLALISELYFVHCDTDWSHDEAEQRERSREKAEGLGQCSFADFGTRRRRSYAAQELAVDTLRGSDSFVGTSNVHFAHRFALKPIGTMAHEWIMGISALESLRYANRYALRIWGDVYQGRLGIALSDTFGTDAFFEEFDDFLSRLFDGIRHDSGDPLVFAEKAIRHYRSKGIDPRTKTIIFSDSLNPEKVREIDDALKEKVKVSFGIGTNLTNDYPGSRPLDIVIKMSECNGVPVVKLSDEPGKQIGERDALRVANWTFFNKLLDDTSSTAATRG